ncbi:PDZ domain-containing protein [Flavobacterium taihuense]|uniref:Aspartyl protease family protein n=1 Tax=Flavobacterium taihuense TaxID=2857508 RepID=A0ABS6XY79_9FLAO|nr:PDZ domain-containing protein [Flavobacterium taihuense]MBW4361640.1 aspartyl protease family protein [Flavobacterium taihuense]
MKKNCVFFLLLISIMPVFAQDGFVFDKEIEKVTVPLILINNLVFIPIKVNGVELNFLLDTGVEETILFSLEDNPDVNFYNSEKITLRGLGSEEAIEGLKTTNNILELNGLTSHHQLIYVILDQSFNLSSQIGIPVNGIIGYQFFKDNLVRIDYASKKVIIYKNDDERRKKIERKFSIVPITIEKFKPYLKGNVVMNESNLDVKMLIDIGNSDSVWLFQNLSEQIKVPVRNFEDFLGKGFSGDIEGKRARISEFSFDKYDFKSPIVAFPDSSSIKSVRMVQNRVGSVGGEILKRFSVIFDYGNERLYLKKNSNFNEPFTYNKSGIEIKHNGLQWVQETVKLETVPLSGGITFDSSGKNITNDFKYKFQLKPIYEIANIRKKSPAANSGLQVGDVIISVNKSPAYRYSLQKMNEMFKSEEDKWIYLEVERNNQILKFAFQLQDIL